MPASKAARNAIHFAGIVACSEIMLVTWVVASAVALSPIINRPDDAPRSEQAFSGFQKFCGLVADCMGFPFGWLPPQALTDSESLVLFSFFGA